MNQIPKVLTDPKTQILIESNNNYVNLKIPKISLKELFALYKGFPTLK